MQNQSIEYISVNQIHMFTLGIEVPSFQIQNGCRRIEMQKTQNMERRQLRMLFGVCILFVVCHTSRIIRSFVELHYISSKEETKECSMGCASPHPLWSHVS